MQLLHRLDRYTVSQQKGDFCSPQQLYFQVGPVERAKRNTVVCFGIFVDVCYQSGPEAKNTFLPLDKAVASRAGFVIVSVLDGRAETLLAPAK